MIRITESFLGVNMYEGVCVLACVCVDRDVTSECEANLGSSVPVTACTQHAAVDIEIS